MGSEMCIRDRVGSERQAASSPTGPKVANVAGDRDRSPDDMDYVRGGPPKLALL